MIDLNSSDTAEDDTEVVTQVMRRAVELLGGQHHEVTGGAASLLSGPQMVRLLNIFGVSLATVAGSVSINASFKDYTPDQVAHIIATRVYGHTVAMIQAMRGPAGPDVAQAAADLDAKTKRGLN